ERSPLMRWSYAFAWLAGGVLMNGAWLFGVDCWLCPREPAPQVAPEASFWADDARKARWERWQTMCDMADLCRENARLKLELDTARRKAIHADGPAGVVAGP